MSWNQLYFCTYKDLFQVYVVNLSLIALIVSSFNYKTENVQLTLCYNSTCLYLSYILDCS